MTSDEKVDVLFDFAKSHYTDNSCGMVDHVDERSLRSAIKKLVKDEIKAERKRWLKLLNQRMERLHNRIRR